MVKLGMPIPEQFESWHDDLLTQSLLSADPDSFPNIIIVLAIGCTLPATSAEAERSFSVLRLIKSHFSSWMADTRFCALTVMKIYYSKHIDSKNIADILT